MKSSLFILLLMSVAVHSQTCPTDQKLIAAEFLKEEFSGRRLQAHSPCLKQNDFKWIQVTHDPPNEEVLKQMIVKPETLVLDKVQLTDKEVGVYTATFQVQASLDRGQTWQNRQETIKYMRDQKKAPHCALLLQSPEVILINPTCQASDKD